tara:strand:- start:213 stop:881 length:669 start_codon:yes stop_codon:yes gene_type:complete
MGDKSLASLQPEFRPRIVELMQLLKGSPHDWKIYNTGRFMDEPVLPCGVKNPAISKTNPCKNPTKHSYGFAADIVPHGNWGGPWKSGGWYGWAELREKAESIGLVNDLDWDRAHVTVPRSEVTMWLQRDLGVADDGIWGPNTGAAAKAKADELGVTWYSALRYPDGELSNGTGLPLNPGINWVTYVELRKRMASRSGGLAVTAGVFFLVVALAVYWSRKGKS